MRWLPQGQRTRSVGGRKKADPTSLLKHLKTLPRSAPYSNPSSSFHILGLSSEGPRSSEKLIIAFRLSILKSKTHHRCIVDRLKRPPKILQTHPPLPRAILFRHFSLHYREFKTNNWREPSSRHFYSIHLKPTQTTSVIRTRTSSNLFAKKNSDSFLQA